MLELLEHLVSLKIAVSQSIVFLFANLNNKLLLSLIQIFIKLASLVSMQIY